MRETDRLLITHLSACSASLALCTSSSLSVIIPEHQKSDSCRDSIHEREVRGATTGPAPVKEGPGASWSTWGRSGAHSDQSHVSGGDLQCDTY